MIGSPQLIASRIGGGKPSGMRGDEHYMMKLVTDKHNVHGLISEVLERLVMLRTRRVHIVGFDSTN